LGGLIQKYFKLGEVGKSWLTLTQNHNILTICLLGKWVRVPSVEVVDGEGFVREGREPGSGR
jgi:hypothetical protein